MVKVKDIYEKINELAPFSIQEKWDNSGLIIGNKEKVVRKILVCLDIHIEVLNHAIKNGVDLIITHHPIIFNPIKNILEEELVYKVINSNISVISAHTNLDMAKGGINDILGEVFELENIEPLSVIDFDRNITLGIVGEMKNDISKNEMFQMIKNKLDVKMLKIGGMTENTNAEKVKRIAICGGAGSNLVKDAIEKNADIYITGELKYNCFVDIKGMDILIIEAGHYETEKVMIKYILEEIKKTFSNEVEVLKFDEKPYEIV